MTAMQINQKLSLITERIAERSLASRALYLARMARQKNASHANQRLSAANLAHGYAALPSGDKIAIMSAPVPMIGIVSAYNDVLSAHQPLEGYPDTIRHEARKQGAVAQFAGGVPAMCDGVTQGQPGMDLSLFSRDAIAQATAIALSHDLYDAVMLLGVCDKIVPGLLIGALSFGHMPAVFVPAGPMTSGLSNNEKSAVRKAFAKGEVDSIALLQAEMAAYHGPGTCTFYGTANSNQLLLEVMGLMLPGAAFINPQDAEREAFTRAATRDLVGAVGTDLSLQNIVTEKSIVNALVALMATGGSTNHTMHWVAIAKAAGIVIDWTDFDEISAITPQLTRVYPNGDADVNELHRAGGIQFLIKELLSVGLLHEDVYTVAGFGLRRYAQAENLSGNEAVLRPASRPFEMEGGLKLLQGNIGRAVVKVSAVEAKHRLVVAPAVVFDNQADVLTAFSAGLLNRDCVVVVRGMGPSACGMPELHKLTPALSVLLDRGFQVGLVTDGRMSGASGKVPAAIHVTPEAALGGVLARIQNGDQICIDCNTGRLELQVAADVLSMRAPVVVDNEQQGFGRELFKNFRSVVSGAEQGASVL
jgi:phosphogluconate dehydratase